MLVGALLDLGASETKVIEAMKSAESCMKGCKKLEISVRDVVRKGFHAKKVDVKAEEANEITGKELLQAIMRCVENLKISSKAKQFAVNSIYTLLNAESRIHGKSVEEVHLHETGSVETIAEIVGAAAGLDELKLFDAKVYSTPVSVGGGLFKFSHGIASSPAPATLEILRSKNFPMIGGPVEFELTTPTGASLLVNLVNEVTRFYPLMKPIAIGYGAGTKDFLEIPNILRITMGESLDQLLKDDVFVLETNVDDISGEVVANALDRLLREGARDVSIVPMFTKKNRPGQILKIIADRTKVEHLTQVVMEETGTLGVRIYPCERRILNRELVPIRIFIGDTEEIVNVKVSKDNEGQIVQIKPEYDDIKKVADKTQKPVREIMELVKIRAREVLLKEDFHGS